MLHSTNFARRQARQATAKMHAEQIVKALANGESRVLIADRLGVKPGDIVPYEREAYRVAKTRAAGVPTVPRVPADPAERRRARKRERHAAKAEAKRARADAAAEAKRMAKQAREEATAARDRAILDDVVASGDPYAMVAERHGVGAHVVGELARKAGIRRGPPVLPDAAYLAAVAELTAADIPVKPGLVAEMLSVAHDTARSRLQRLGIATVHVCPTCGDPSCSSELCGALTPADANRVHVWRMFNESLGKPSRHVGPRPDAQQITRGEGEPHST